MGRVIMIEFITKNTFAITIVFIVLSTLVAALIRRTKKDKCLKDFAGFMVTVEDTTGKTIWGQLRVENTGLEFVYPVKHADEQGHIETSFLLYKHEYNKIVALLRFHDQLSEKNKRKRKLALEKAYHPTLLRRIGRKAKNVFKTIRDSVAEVVNMVIAQAQKATPAGGVLTKQDKYVSQIKQELMGSIGTSYEPLLERYIGHKVVLELIKGDKLIEYCGVLKEYTADFIEIMDVNYEADKNDPDRITDMIVSRKFGIIRHFAE